VPRDRLAARLESTAGAWSADEAAGAKVLGPLVALSVSIAVGLPLLALPLAVVAWRAPEFLLGRRARRRASQASSEVPLFLDLLSVSCSAGLAPQLAVRLAAQPLRGPLADELGVAIDRTDLGRRWRDEIAAVADRLGLVDLHRAAAVLGRSEALGSSLADEMSRLAADVREARRARAAERARTAPVKMLFPLVFLILPAFLLLTVVPVLLSTVQSIG
jgi:tight adherence protein C